MPGDNAEFLNQLAEDGVSLDGRGREAAPASPTQPPNAPDGAAVDDGNARQSAISASLAQSRHKPEASVLDVLSRPMKSRLAATSFQPDQDPVTQDMDPLEGVVPKAAVGLNLFGTDALKDAEGDTPPEESDEDYDELSPEELAVLLSDSQGPAVAVEQEAAPGEAALEEIAAAEGESPVVVMQRVIEESLAEEPPARQGPTADPDTATPPPAAPAPLETAAEVPQASPSPEAPQILVHPDTAPAPGTQQPPAAETAAPAAPEATPAAPEEQARTRPAANPMTKPVEPWVAEMAFEEHRNAVQAGEVEPNPAQAAAARAGQPAADAPDPAATAATPAAPEEPARTRPAANPMTKPVEPWVAEMAFEEHRIALQSGEVEPNPAQAAAARAAEQVSVAPDPTAAGTEAEVQDGDAGLAPPGETGPSADAASVSESPGGDPSSEAAAPEPAATPDRAAAQDGLAPIGFQGMEAESISWRGDETDAAAAEPTATIAQIPCQPSAAQTEAAPAEDGLWPELAAPQQDQHAGPNPTAATQNGADGARPFDGLPELGAFRIQFDPDLVPADVPEYTGPYQNASPIDEPPLDHSDPQARPGNDGANSPEEDMAGLGFEEILRAVEEDQPAMAIDSPAGDQGDADPPAEPAIDGIPQQDAAPVPETPREQPRPDIALEGRGGTTESPPPSAPEQGTQATVDQQAREAIKRTRVSSEKSGLAAKWKAFRSKESDDAAES